MKSNKLLVLSLILNLGLIAMAAYLVKNRSSRHSETVVIKEEPQTNSNVRVMSKKVAVTATNEAPGRMFDWRSVESADYKQYIANLRSVGCPEETIRDVIIADVNKLFESRQKALKSAKKFEYWKSGNMFAGMIDEELMKKKQELANEKKALLKELLGIEPEEKADFAAITNPLTGLLDFLSEDKQAKVAQVMQEFQTRTMKAFGGKGAPDAEDMKEMQKVQKELEKELAKIMTPEEFEDYQLRLSQTAMVMRMQLGTFDPTEQEFRDVFKIKKTFDDEFGFMGMGATTKSDREKMDAAKKEMDEQLKQLLGESRYAEYERSQDYQYQGLVKFADRQGLSSDVVNRIYEMEKLSKEEIGNLRKNSALTREKRDEAMNAIKTETQRSIREAMGEAAYQAYTNRTSFGGF